MILNMEKSWQADRYETFSVLYDNKTVKKFKTERVNPADFGKWLENSRKLICEEVPDAKAAVLFYGKNAPIKSEPLPVAPEGHVFKMIDGKLRLLKLPSPAEAAEKAINDVLAAREEAEEAVEEEDDIDYPPPPDASIPVWNGKGDCPEWDGKLWFKGYLVTRVDK